MRSSRLTVLEQVVPVIDEYDEYIKKNYGPVTRSISYEFPKGETKSTDVFHEEFETVLAFYRLY